MPLHSSLFKLRKNDLKVLFHKRLYKAGRSAGRIACNHRGGSRVKRFLNVNFFKRIFNVLGQIVSIIKDPIRSGFVALVFYKVFGIFEYILCPHSIKVGDFILASNSKNSLFSVKFSRFFLNIGNSFFLQDLKIGSHVFNIERKPGMGGVLMRAAGTTARLVQKIQVGANKLYAAIRLRTGHVFYLQGRCLATLGQCSNVSHSKTNLKKAGMVRRIGFRPVVRGVAMNPIDHPHGGGEGKTSGGRSSVSPWGKLTKGKKTVTKAKRLKQKSFVRRMRFGLALQ